MPPYGDVVGIANPTTNVTVRVVGGTTYTAARKGEYFQHALNVPNGTAQYPSVEVKSLYGATQAETNKVFVPAATESPTHDADGNLTQDGRWTYTWDGENRLVQMIRDTDSPSGGRQKLVFEYDHQGRRIRKTFSTYGAGWQEQSDLIFLYDGWNLVAELDANSSNAKVRTYVWGTDLLGTLTGAGGVGGLLWLNNHQSTFEGKTLPTGVQYAAYDGNGNVAALVKAADGSVTARYDYGPFAEPIRASGAMAKANPVRFSTKYTDYQSGLVYYGHRYYGPSIGKCFNRDPVGNAGGMHLYCLLQNSLVNAADYLGLEPVSSYNLTVRRCEILIVYGHHWLGDMERTGLQQIKTIKPRQSPHSCAFAAVLGCNAHLVPNEIPLPGYTPVKGACNTRRDPEDPGFPNLDDEIPKVEDAAVKAAEKLCDCCCKTVRVETKVFGWTRRERSIYPAPNEGTYSCSKRTYKRDFFWP